MATPSMSNLRPLLQRISIGVGAILIITLILRLDSGQSPVPLLNLSQVRPGQEAPNLYLSDVTIRQYDRDGKLSAITKAPTTEHFASSGQTSISQPRFSVESRDELWLLRADQAWYQDDRSQFKLAGNVQAVRQRDQLTVTAEELLWHHNQHRISTDGPVTVTASNGVLSATGFNAHLQQDRYELLSDVKGEYYLAP